MQESLSLFESVISSKYLKESSIVLFLGKMDIFKQKIKDNPVSKYFPDFEGPKGDYDSAVTYFTNKFRALLPPNDNRKIRIYTVDALDTRMLREVLRDIESKVIIRPHHTQKSGLGQHAKERLTLFSGWNHVCQFHT